MRCLIQFGLTIALIVAAQIALAANVNIGTYQSWISGLNTPHRVVEHPITHDLYIADFFNHIVRRVQFGTTTAQEWLGTLGAGSGNSFAAGTGARLYFPTDMIMTSDGTTIYLVDQYNHVLRKVNVADAVNTPFAGVAGTSGANDGTGTGAKFNTPTCLAQRGTDLFLTEYFGARVRKTTVPGAVVTTVVGTAGTGILDGSSSTAKLQYAAGLAYHAGSDTFFMANTEAHIIRKMLPDGTTTTVAGQVSVSGSADGDGLAATFKQPRGVTVDPTQTYVYIADKGNSKIRRMLLASPFTVDTVSAASVPAPNFLSLSRDNNILYAGLSSAVGYFILTSTATTTTPAPSTSTSTTPVPSTSTSTTPVPSTSTSTTPVPSTSTSTTPVPSTSTSTTGVPSTSSTTSSVIVPPGVELPPNFTIPANFTGFDGARGWESILLSTAALTLVPVLALVAV